MPNWCKNGLHVRGEEAEVKRFLGKIKHEKHYEILNSLFPCPDELHEIKSGAATINGQHVERWREAGDGTERIMTALTLSEESSLVEKYGAKDWYHWCVENWGTKWGDCETTLAYEYKGYLCFTFESAWGAPIEGFDHIAKEYPTLRFMLKYGQGETEFEGYAVWKNGKLIREAEWEWNRFELDSDYLPDTNYDFDEDE